MPDTRPRAEWSSLGRYHHRPRPGLYLPPERRDLRGVGCALGVLSAVVSSWLLGWFGLALYRLFIGA